MTYTGSYPSTTTRRAAATLAAATMLLALASGCRSHERAPAAAPSGASPSGSSAASPGTSAATPASASASAISTRPAGSYHPATAPCRLLDTGRLVAALGPDAGDLLKPRSDNLGPAVAAHCLHRYGPVSARSLVFLDITTVKQGTAQVYYDGLRGAQQKQTPIADVPNLGQGAYIYTDPQTGTHLAMYDGNLYLTIGINQPVGRKSDPAQLQPVLVEAAGHAAAGLRKG